MHELSLVQSIVETCRACARGARVRRVTLEVGALSCVMPEAMRFCFAAVTENTTLQGAELEILVLPARSRCRECGRELSLHTLLDTCSCGSGNLEPPDGGDQLRIQSMEIEEVV